MFTDYTGYSQLMSVLVVSLTNNDDGATYRCQAGVGNTTSVIHQDITVSFCKFIY